MPPAPSSQPPSTLELTTDPAAFLAEVGDHLAAEPVLSTVVATVTARMAEDPRAFADAPHRWWAVARDGAGTVAGVAMRTAPFVPYPAYVLPMPEDAARTLARTLHERGEELAGVNGALPAARIVAEESARLTGRTAAVDERLRLFELGELVLPAAPAGRLRAAGQGDADLCLAWYRDFNRAAAEQAGRDGLHGASESFTPEEMRVRIDQGLVWLWEVDGRPVHLTGMNLPANGVVRVGPVYTPTEHRGRGYASRAVAEVSAAQREAGHRCCLFTDQANPVSNRIYEALGYSAVVDMANLVIG